jgi:capsular exopolysaccharide synthesis family protein
VSKFFKALEKVEQEREAAAASAAASGPAPPAAAPAAVVSEAEARPATGAAAAAPASPAPPVRRVPPPTSPVRAVPPPVHRETAPASPPFAKTPPTPPVYGAPLARDGSGRHDFAWQMEPPVATELGDIDDHLVSLLAPTSFAAEQYRAVRLALETLHRERGTRVIGVASPARGEGRTMTAINLAGALAQAPDARVVLVEADLRHPSIAQYLGLPPGRGLSGYLLDARTTLDGVLERPSSIAFTVLTAGSASSMPYELLKSPRLTALIGELRERFDYVLLDTPSALPFPDVGILRDLVDGFVVVVRANRTPRERLLDSVNVLGRQRALGLIFNDDEGTAVPTFAENGDSGWRRLMPRPLGTRA